MNLWFTASKDGFHSYGIWAKASWNLEHNRTCLDSGKPLKYKVKDGKVILNMPKDARLEPFAFKIK